MAILEVHDGRGRVERVAIARDQPAMFGSSPKCDIVLNGEGILPFHGRLRWQERKKRFKVDASPEAEYLLINGHKMSASSFRQGDEIAVGGCRIFMVNDGEPELKIPPPRDDVTRVQAPTFIPPPAEGAVITRGSWRNNLEVAPPSGETAVADYESTPKAEPRGRRAQARPAPGGMFEETNIPERGWLWFFRRFSARGYAPGDERVMSSPLVFGLGAALVALVLAGISLYGIIVRTTATRLFNRAVETLEDGEYRNAIRLFDDFIKANPEDVRSGKARVHRAMANVRQYTAGAGASWSLALEAERAMLDDVGGEESYRDSSTELDELVLRTGEMLADRAKGAADAKTLSEAEAAVTLHNRIAGKAAEAFLKKSRLPEKLASARAAVRKAHFRRDRLAAMDAALKAGSSQGVYGERDALVAEYADQSEDRELLARMIKANDLIRKAVKLDLSARPAETEPHPHPLGPPTTIVLRATESGPADAAPATDGPLVFALADGFAFGIDAGTGAPVWQVAVGLSSPYPPLPIPGGSTVLVFDASHGELVRLDARTGSLVWRQALGERVDAPPLVLGNQVVQATPGGKVVVIDLPTGAVRATLDLGLPLSGTPVSDEAGLALYVTARKDCLFVLSRDPLGCAAVEYLGHATGSIACPPARLGRYLIIAENHQLNESRWRVFVLGEDGLGLKPVQQVPVLGWTWGTPASSGSVVWAAGDRGGVAAYAVGAYGEKEPFRLIARTPPDERPSGPAFAFARSEKELFVGSGRSGRYELNAEGGKLATTWTLGEAGPAIAPPRVAGSRVVLTQQNPDGPGVALLGVNPQSGALAWRTVLGADWPSVPESSGADALSTLGADGRVLTLPLAALTKGGFVTAELPKPGRFRLPHTVVSRIEGEGWTVIVPALRASRLYVREGTGAFKEVSLPAPVGARPLAWGRELLVPGDDGRVYLLDPLTGESRAEPFVPPFDRTRPTRWRTPVRLGPDAVAMVDDSGKVRRLTRVNDPRPRLVAGAEQSLGKELIAEPASTKSAVILVTSDGRVRALAARDLSPVGAWPLSASLVLPPSSVGGRCYLADASGGVLALGEDGQRLWSASLSSKAGPVEVSGSPAVRGPAVWFLGRGGTLHALGLEDGSPLGSFPVDTLPAGGPIAVGSELAIPVGRGALRMLTIDSHATQP